MAAATVDKHLRVRRFGECLLVMAACAGCSYLFALPAVGWLAEAGIIRKMGGLQMPPTLFSPADVKLMALLAAVCAGNFVGLLLYLLPRYPFLSLPGLYWPFAILAVAAPFMTHPEGVWYRGLLSGLGFLILALGQWMVCWVAFRLLLRLRRLLCRKPGTKPATLSN